VCRIPANHDEDLYDMTGVRLTQSSEWIVGELVPVSDYFTRLSSGRFRLDFELGARDVEPAVGNPQQCVDGAIDQARPEADGVLVVADAQHRSDRSGGWGRDGVHCGDVCAVGASRRAVYVGAADFVGLGSTPLDLIEHEVGHALGWPHSRWRTEYDSPIDVMSDSAAARRGDESQVHAPGTLAINRYLSGWLDRDPVVLDGRRSTTTSIDVSSFAVVPISPTSMITVEIVDTGGDRVHLESPGIAVHLVDWGPEVCARATAGAADEELLCRGTARRQVLAAPRDATDGLVRVGERVEIAGVLITLTALDRTSAGDGPAVRSRGWSRVDAGGVGSAVILVEPVSED
jgi:hypothetical protein